MQGLVERARQALGVGPDAFLASTLDAQELTLKELDVFAPNLRDMVKAAQTFAGDTDKFLTSTAHYVTEAPLPQLWMQGSASEPAQVTQLPVPAEHAAWFDASIAEREASIVPGAVGYSLQRELVTPMEQWLWAHQVAQGRLSELRSGRLDYDSERRKLVQRATAATSSHSEHAGTSLDPALAQLTEEAAAINRTLSEYESDVEALDDLLHWLVEGAVRLKALLADVSGAVGSSADSWTIPPGIMPPFPEKSSFGKDLEATVTLSNSPLGAKTEEVVATSTAASHNDDDVTTVTSFRPHTRSHTAAAHGGGEAGHTDTAQPDLSALLPSDDAMVYGGGVAPPSGGAQPSGGGVGQLLKDTLIPPTSDTTSSSSSNSSSGGSKEVAEGGNGEGIIPHLSDVLPSEGDDVTAENTSHTELAPLPGSRHNRPSGGGIGQFLKESLTGIVTPNEGEGSRSSEAPSQSRSEAAPAKLAPLPGSQHAQPSGGGVGQLLKESVTGKVTPNAGEDTAAEAEGQAEGSKGEGAAAAASPPDLSALLPSDDAVVYGGGVAPTQDTGRAAPSGGGVWQMVKDTFRPAGKDESSASADESTTLPAAPEIASRSAHIYSGEGTGRVEARTPDAAAAGLGAGQRRLGRAWSGDTPGATASGQDQRGDVSAEGKELAIVPAAPPTNITGATAYDRTAELTAETAIGDADDADLPTTDLTAAAPATADSSSSSSGDSNGGGGAAAVGGVWARLKHTVAEAGSAAAAAAAGARSTAAAAASAVASAVPGVGRGSDEVDEVADVVGEELTGDADGRDVETVEAVVEAFHDAQGGDAGPIENKTPAATTAAAAAATDSDKDTADVSAWAADDAGTTPPVGLTDPAPADPAPDQPEMPAAMPTAAYPPMAGPAPSAENIKQTARRVRESLSQYSEATGGSAEAGAEAPPHMGPVALPESVVGDPTAAGGTSAAAHEQGEMHIGPVTPSDGPSDAAPGSANWVKGATQPGGAAAGQEGEVAAAGKDSGEVSQGQMHIGPEQPASGPTTPAPGSAIWFKEATRPGGAAAAAAAPAGSSDDTEAELDTVSNNGPDLSKVLPSVEQSVSEPTAKPEGGGIGTFIKETLLGPSK